MKSSSGLLGGHDQPVMSHLQADRVVDSTRLDSSPIKAMAYLDRVVSLCLLD